MRFQNFKHYCDELKVIGSVARARFEMICMTERFNNSKSIDEQHEEAIEMNIDFIANQIVDANLMV
jgi:hypothetical protein